MDTPYAMVRLGSVASTQPEARARFVRSPVLVSAARQTAGRGRSGNIWIDAPRAVAASLAVRPPWPAETWPRLTLVAGVAAREALGGRVGLKWPNDLVAGGAKVGGIIAEADGGVMVVGLGVNLWWPEPIEGAGALEQADPGPDEPHRIAEEWAERLVEMTSGDPEAWPREEYAAACLTLGREVVWDGAPGPGRAVGIAPDGGLEVATATGVTVIRAGEVRAVRTPR